jgi:hypothetical protein
MKILEPSLTDEELARLERDTFKYFADEVNLENGLVPDNTRADSPSSIAAVGFALTAYPIAVERKYLSRAEAVRRTLTTLRFFYDCPQGKQRDATGYKGFYYHFLDMKTGRRAGNCEISAGGRAHRRVLFQSRHKERTRHPHVGGGALPPRRLALGAEWRADSFTRLATRTRIHQVSLDWLQ